MKENCIFCKIIQGEAPGTLVTESEHFIALRDIHPKVPGHSFVIPKEHHETFLDLPKESYKEFLEITHNAIQLLLKETNTEGYNLAMNNKQVAGQVVPHLHFHILPRKENDGFHLFK